MRFLRNGDIGILILRVSVGLMMLIGHGWSKLQAIGTDKAANFADPIGLGPVASQFLAAMAEGVGSVLLIIGLFSRGAAFALMFTMLVAAFIAHGNDPFFPQRFVGVVPEFKALNSPYKEFVLLYAVAFAALFFTGAGKYSIDTKLRKRLPKPLQYLT